jgi:hypothetical protein
MSAPQAARDASVTVTVPGQVLSDSRDLQGERGRPAVRAGFRYTSVTVTVPGHGPARQWPKTPRSEGMA